MFIILSVFLLKKLSKRKDTE